MANKENLDENQINTQVKEIESLIQQKEDHHEDFLSTGYFTENNNEKSIEMITMPAFHYGRILGKFEQILKNINKMSRSYIKNKDGVYKEIIPKLADETSIIHENPISLE